MLISLDHRFVFVANLRSASTAIESALRPWSDIAITQTSFGKHDSFAEIERRFAWAFDCVPRRRFLVFGVMRDPLEQWASLWRLHRGAEFRDQPAFTGAMGFEAFLTDWVRANPWQSAPQWQRFSDGNGAFALDYLIDYASLRVQFTEVLGLLGLPPIELARENISRAEAPDLETIRPGMRERLDAEFALDRQLLRTLSGRLLRDWQPG
jgi:hypothetical protein